MNFWHCCVLSFRIVPIANSNHHLHLLLGATEVGRFCRNRNSERSENHLPQAAMSMTSDFQQQELYHLLFCNLLYRAIKKNKFWLKNTYFIFFQNVPNITLHNSLTLVDPVFMNTSFGGLKKYPCIES